MGKKKGGGPRPAGLAKRGGPRRGPKGGAELDDEMVFDEVEQFHREKEKRQEDFVALNGAGGSEGSDDEDEEEGVFDLDVGGEGSSEDSGSDDDDDDDGSGSSDGESGSDADEGPLPGVERAGLLSDEEEDDEDDEDDARKVRQWGRSKQQYYNADATDLEIGQDFADAEEEEAAAREVERARMEEMEEGDYGAFDEEEEEGETVGVRLKQQGQGKTKAGSGAGAGAGAGAGGAGLAALLAGGGGSKGVETATVARDLSRLSKAGKLQVLVSDAPELLALLEEFREKLGELRERVEPLIPLVRQGGGAGRGVTEEGVAYLEVKQQLLLSYCINLTYYLLLKAEGRPVRDHPVMAQLLELRAAMEKLRPLDAKLKGHVDRLLRVAEMSREALAAGKGRDPLSFRPNPEALLGKAGGGGGLDDEGGDQGSEEEDGGDGGAGGGVYRPPRLAAVPYDEDGGKGGGKRGQEEERARRSLEKLRRSEILQTLAEQFSDKPEMVSERRDAGALERRRQEEAEERRRYEEERFVRLVTSKKEKKLRQAAEREATRLETIADIGDFHDLEQSLAALGPAAAGTAGSAGKAKALKDGAAAASGASGASGASALQRAVNSLAQKERSKKRRRERELAGDADVPYRNPDEIRVRRPAPGDGDGDVNGGLDASDAAVLEALGGRGGGGKRKKQQQQHQGGDGDGDDGGGVEVPGMPVAEDPYYEAVAAKRAGKRAEKAALYGVEATDYGAMEAELAVGEGEKRGISYQILKNRGLTAYKSKLNRNPRVKKREAFRKATIRRKGQVRDVRASEAASYGGEATGINARVVRVRGKK